MYDNRSPVVRVDEFDEQHGRNGVTINGWKVFADGARRDTHCMGPLHEPPADDLERWGWQAKYHEKRMKDAANEFDVFKLELKRRIQFGGTVGDIEIERLKRLQRLVLSEKKRLEAYQQKISDHPTTKRRHALQLYDEQSRAAGLAQLDKIEI